MAKHGKNYRGAFDKVDKETTLTPQQGFEKVKEASFAKFDESVDVDVRLGIDPAKGDQVVRGSVVLPHNLGRKVRVIVFAKDKYIDQAVAAGADEVGSTDLIEKITGGKTLLRILSNYSTRRMVKAEAIFEKEAVGGEQVVDNIILAFEFADNDVYRAVTHNKGIMNGTIAVANAVGQDSRAIEAAANAYAAKSGKYRSLSKWSKDDEGNLVGILEIPLSVGIVGGIANVHPVAKVCAKIIGATSAKELACVMTATGLAQNYSAIRALSTEGIQKGHMRLHARNLAAAAGATPAQIDQIVEKMVQVKSISLDKAKELLQQT